MNSEPRSLGESLPLEIQRVSEILGVYKTLGPSGRPAAFLMTQSIERANKAIWENDIPAMIVALKDLQEYSQ